MNRKIFLAVLVLISAMAFAQKPLERVEPPNWWAGFKDNSLQLMLYGKDISNYEIAVDAKAFVLEKSYRTDNPNYQFVDLLVKPEAKPGTYPIWFSQNGKRKFKYDFVLGEKTAQPKGISQKDLIYLIMPDRFANGDYSNDIVKSLREKTINRDSMYYRHGGDLQGIISKMDYLKDLGITAIWNTPELENDMAKESYHGYAATDLYKIDPRYGTNELYRKYVETAHSKGLKIIKDVVPNHIGSFHWWMQDLPMKNWVHQFPQYTNTTYRFEPLQDPYASKFDYDIAEKGWFVPTMPDMNHDNPFVAKYLIQNYLWWIEYAKVDGFRIDTFSYNDLKFNAEWLARIRSEYPSLGIFGETLMYQPSNQAYFTEGKKLGQEIDSNLPGITDSAWKEAVYEALNGKFGWYDGVNRLYNLTAQDFLYQNPEKNVIFLDNHDMSRFFSVVGEDFEKFKSGIILLLTSNKIPQLYYGTEILMKNFSNPDGLVRSDMKGGWMEDKVDQFSKSGRTAQENLAFDFIKKLANFRKNSPALTEGKMVQFFPQHGVYAYSRSAASQKILVVYNSLEKEMPVEAFRYKEITDGFSKFRDVMTGETFIDLNNLKLKPKESRILELVR
ncbi:glycoside hydrolase family 13 protein [Cruoricaptor ignavus]|uniref:glycoside hydrolase family 13 protein n=1 Tax=Cruoricaptor ignavus TaxID=1118202 RepID=UPI00370DB55B